MEYKLTGDNSKKQNVFRNEIEKIIREEHIDRKRFHEFSKDKFDEVIRKFYYSFCDHTRFFTTTVTLSYRRLHFRNNIDYFAVASLWSANWDWEDYLGAIKSSLSLYVGQKLFLLLEEGWVYEGYTDEMFQILKEIDYHMNFFILSNQFNWFIAHDYIEECALMYCR